MPNTVAVAAALICQGGRFLIGQRPAHKARGLLWEFVGGKLEPGETGPEALSRECRDGVGFHQAVHLIRIPGEDHYQVVPVVFHAGDEGINGLLAEVAPVALLPEE